MSATYIDRGRAAEVVARAENGRNMVAGIVNVMGHELACTLTPPSPPPPPSRSTLPASPPPLPPLTEPTARQPSPSPSSPPSSHTCEPKKNRFRTFTPCLSPPGSLVSPPLLVYGDDVPNFSIKSFEHTERSVSSSSDGRKRSYQTRPFWGTTSHPPPPPLSTTQRSSSHLSMGSEVFETASIYTAGVVHHSERREEGGFPSGSPPPPPPPPPPSHYPATPSTPISAGAGYSFVSPVSTKVPTSITKFSPYDESPHALQDVPYVGRELDWESTSLIPPSRRSSAENYSRTPKHMSPTARSCRIPAPRVPGVGRSVGMYDLRGGGGVVSPQVIEDRCTSPMRLTASGSPQKSLMLLMYENVNRDAAAVAQRNIRAAQMRMAYMLLCRVMKRHVKIRYETWLAWKEFMLQADYFDEPPASALLRLREGSAGLIVSPQRAHRNTESSTQTIGTMEPSPALSSSISSASAKSVLKSPRLRLMQMLSEESVKHVVTLAAVTLVSLLYEKVGAYMSGTQWFYNPSQLSGGVLTNDIHLPIPPYNPERQGMQVPSSTDMLPSPRTEPMHDEDSLLDESLPGTPVTPKSDDSGDLPLKPIISNASADTSPDSPLAASQPGFSGTHNSDAPESGSTGPGGLGVKEQRKLATRSPRHQKVLSPKMRPPDHILESRPEAHPPQAPQQSQTLRQEPSGRLSAKLSSTVGASSVDSSDPGAKDSVKPDQSMVESLERSCLSIAGAVATSHAVKKLVESIGTNRENKLDQSQGTFSVLDLNGSTESDPKKSLERDDRERSAAEGHLTPPTRSPNATPTGVSPRAGPNRHLAARNRRNTKVLGDSAHPKDEFLERYSPRAASGSQVTSMSSSMKSNVSHDAHAATRDSFLMHEAPITLRLNNRARRPESTRQASPPRQGEDLVPEVYAVGDSLELDPQDKGGARKEVSKKIVVCITSPRALKADNTTAPVLSPRGSGARETVLRQRVAPVMLASPPRRRGAHSLRRVVGEAPSGEFQRTLTEYTSPQRFAPHVAEQHNPPMVPDTVRTQSPHRDNAAAYCSPARGLSPLSELEEELHITHLSPESVRDEREEVEEFSLINELHRLRAENALLQKERERERGGRHTSPVREEGRRGGRSGSELAPDVVMEPQYDHDPLASPHRNPQALLRPVTNPRDFKSVVLPYSGRTRNLEDPIRVPLARMR